MPDRDREKPVSLILALALLPGRIRGAVGPGGNIEVLTRGLSRQARASIWETEDGRRFEVRQGAYGTEPEGIDHLEALVQTKVRNLFNSYREQMAEKNKEAKQDEWQERWRE